MVDPPATADSKITYHDDTIALSIERPRKTINDFADEILMAICKNLYSQSDLYNLCLVTPFKQVATELLYHTCNSRSRKFSLIALLSTVLRHPELAALIRGLDLTIEAHTAIPVANIKEVQFFIKH